MPQTPDIHRALQSRNDSEASHSFNMAVKVTAVISGITLAVSAQEYNAAVWLLAYGGLLMAQPNSNSSASLFAPRIR